MRIPDKPLTYEQILKKFADPDFFRPFANALAKGGISPAPGGQYRHWDTLRQIAPPEGLTHEAWWAAIKFARLQTRRFIPLRDRRGNPFSYTMPAPVLEMLHEIDQNASGRIAMPDSTAIATPQTRSRYLQSSLIEEAITSSQLEGAAATREQAKALLRSNRKPMNYAEWMILGNYRAMQLISSRKEQEMTPALVREIHQTIAAAPFSPDADAPRVRKPGDDVAVRDERNRLLHQPPDASEIPARMKALCAFANHNLQGKDFMHPVVRAVLLHFWLAYDHPFTDGNGRTARVLFYWCMLKQGYWLAEFISISSILRKASAAYVRSFLYTETDDNDLSYFLLAQLRVIRRAIGELHEYIKRKNRDIRETEQVMRASVGMNHRQTALLGHALRNPGFRYTIESHRHSHRVTYQTARTDLLGLSEKGLLLQSRAGRRFSFAAAPDLEKRLRALR